MADFASYIRRGTTAAQPAASSVSVGTLYSKTDASNAVDRSNGATWDAYAPAGGGDVTGPASSVDSEIALFSSTTGKIIKRASTTGVLKASSGVLAAAVAGTDYNAPTTTGTIRQVVNTQTGGVATGTTTIPIDDTIPQITEGDEYMTLAITPTNAANKLRVDVVFQGSVSVASWLTAALFQDTTANALAVGMTFQGTGTAGNTITFTHYMTAGTTSATTFRVRAGKNNTGTVTFNGGSGTRLFGGVMASSITITEIVP